MLVFPFAISYLTTSNLPWFMDLTFQVPMPYFPYSIGLSPPHTSTPECHIRFGLTSSSFWSFSLLFCSRILYTYPGDLSSSVISFCLFILFMGFSRQEYWSGLPLPSSVDCLLLELSTMIHLSWVTQTWVSYIAGRLLSESPGNRLKFHIFRYLLQQHVSVFQRNFEALNNRNLFLHSSGG